MVRWAYPIAFFHTGRRLIGPIKIAISEVSHRRFSLMSRQLFRKPSMSDTECTSTKRQRMETVLVHNIAVTNGYEHLAPVHGGRLLTKVEMDNDQKQFDEIFTTLADDILNIDDVVTSDAMQRFRRVIEYNVPHGKKNRGLTVVHSYRYLSGDSCTDDGVRLAMVLGWCVEYLQAYFLVADDIMDSSLTRRGQPCWYKQDDVKMAAINDSFFLECCIYTLLRKYFRHLPYYVDLVDLFHETTLQTVVGQNLDLITGQADQLNLAAYTIERYNTIVRYKTAFYSFYLPVACAMYMNGISDKQSHDNARTILLKMGEFFQIQDDFLDAFGDPAVMGKVGTDIEDSKCSWLIVQALSRASDEQRAILEANYGRPSADCVANVKAVYKDLKLQQVYTDFEDRSYAELLQLIEDCSANLPRDMFIVYANKIFKRQK